ncbi:c-type cytochrome [Methylobacterium brachythecii]|nr:c-type cytochrome [Methylobacterium brachythecii]
MPALVLAAVTSWSAVAAERLPAGASSCSGCHSAGSTEMPALTGFTVSEIEAAMAAFRSGTRGGTIMPRIAKGFSPGEARAIAAFLGRDRQSAP